MSDMTPVSRLEYFLAKIIGDDVELPEPQTDVELYLAAVAGETVELPPPASRWTLYLAKILGQNVELPVPQSRADLYLAKLAGEDVELPPMPLTRSEAYLALWADGAGGETLTVTGVAPITLANAIAHAIVSLTQSGKCTQADTPTPSDPVDIKCNNGALKYSPNLLDSSAENTTLGKYIEKSTGKVSNSASNFMFEEYIPVVGGKTYVAYGRTWDGTGIADYNRIAWYNSSKAWISGANYTQNQISVATAPSNAAYARFSCNITGSSSTTVTQELVDSYYWVFQEGNAEPSVVHPYHELYVEGTPEVLSVAPIGSATQDGTPAPDNYAPVVGTKMGNTELFAIDTDADTYDPSTQTITRVIGKMVFNGTETFSKSTAYGNAFLVNAASSSWGADKAEAVLCTHFLGLPQSTSTKADNTCFFNQTGHFYFRVTDNSDANAFKSWLAEQYAAGTPVVVYFVRSSSTTEAYTGSPVGSTASVADLFAVGDYKDTQELIGGTVTHKCGIKVFDGTENISTSNACFTVAISDKVTTKAPLLCSHFPYSNKTSSQTDDETIIAFASTNIGFRYDACANKTAFAAFLKAQYDAGTPVIVVYPLAEETTESVTGQSLSTNEGTNVVSVTAEVSDITLTAEYKGAA